MMPNEYDYPIKDGTECNYCGDTFKDEVCQGCEIEPFGGPMDDDWISRAYERQGNPFGTEIE